MSLSERLTCTRGFTWLCRPQEGVIDLAETKLKQVEQAKNGSSKDAILFGIVGQRGRFTGPVDTEAVLSYAYRLGVNYSVSAPLGWDISEFLLTLKRT